MITDFSLTTGTRCFFGLTGSYKTDTCQVDLVYLPSGKIIEISDDEIVEHSSKEHMTSGTVGLCKYVFENPMSPQDLNANRQYFITKMYKYAGLNIIELKNHVSIFEFDGQYIVCLGCIQFEKVH